MIVEKMRTIISGFLIASMLLLAGSLVVVVIASGYQIITNWR